MCACYVTDKRKIFSIVSNVVVALEAEAAQRRFTKNYSSLSAYEFVGIDVRGGFREMVRRSFAQKEPSVVLKLPPK